jgi:hypothetical protein
VKAPFCNTVGAEMDDSMTFSVYLDQLDDEKETEEKKTGDKEGDENNEEIECNGDIAQAQGDSEKSKSEEHVSQKNR